ncbi:MAG: HD domain-containing protein [Desulfatitalea sp.]|nr:HD domain-containing protein [Desulfatitalea sp.]NNK02261.1 HD domain-containing protein [Desulfatitalea sp.]
MNTADLKQDSVLGIAAEKQGAPSRLHSSSTQVLYTMTAALGQRDTYTHAHAQRVAAYSRRLAQQACVSSPDLDNVTLGGMLHDVGKIALSDLIFSNKQASLSKELQGEVQSHPVIGAAMLRHARCNKVICQTVLYHHERIDGSGYPFGLKDHEIPLGAKIVSVADCFDAITTDRPYQRRKTLYHAFRILEEMAGRQCLDGNLVALMVKDIQTNGIEHILPASDTLFAAFK